MSRVSRYFPFLLAIFLNPTILSTAFSIHVSWNSRKLVVDLDNYVPYTASMSMRRSSIELKAKLFYIRIK